MTQVEKSALFQKLVEVLLAQPKKPVRIGIFGSYARGEERPDSDLDVLVHYERPFSLFDLAHCQVVLEDALHVKVDVLTEGSLKRIKAEVEKDLVPVYTRQ